ncbi:MAG: xanthine dehydrogenase accessory protein XdhC [Burkholderiales bacterium]
MNEWLGGLARAGERGLDAVLVTVAAGTGSTPREPGVKMAVTLDAIHGTIGGGEMEFQAIGVARGLLGANRLDAPGDLTSRRYPLGATLGQHCGGAADLIFERVPYGAEWVKHLARVLEKGEAWVAVTPIDGASDVHLHVSTTATWGTLGDAGLDTLAMTKARALLASATSRSTMIALEPAGRAAQSVLLDPVRPSDFRVVLFGAGHVGRALVGVLSALSCEVDWIDSRAHEFPAELPPNVHMILTERPVDVLNAARRGSYFLVMTHSHALDFELVKTILERGEFAYCGMIGSSTKRRTFENSLAKLGVARAALDRFICPIGIDGIGGKEPGSIAVGVAAQLLMVRERASG